MHAIDIDQSEVSKINKLACDLARMSGEIIPDGSKLNEAKDMGHYWSAATVAYFNTVKRDIPNIETEIEKYLGLSVAEKTES